MPSSYSQVDMSVKWVFIAKFAMPGAEFRAAVIGSQPEERQSASKRCQASSFCANGIAAYAGEVDGSSTVR